MMIETSTGALRVIAINSDLDSFGSSGKIDIILPIFVSCPFLFRAWSMNNSSSALLILKKEGLSMKSNEKTFSNFKDFSNRTSVIKLARRISGIADFCISNL
mmetsp:Transcript_718/g.1061  ORF Transcript_718/g.1061 Transcript_718/m.1061 type:complete len:102 (-) Transcript_718:1162-1467(-)